MDIEEKYKNKQEQLHQKDVLYKVYSNWVCVTLNISFKGKGKMEKGESASPWTYRNWHDLEIE